MGEQLAGEQEGVDVGVEDARAPALPLRLGQGAGDVVDRPQPPSGRPGSGLASESAPGAALDADSEFTPVVEAPGIEPGSEAASRETSTSVVPVLFSPIRRPRKMRPNA